MPADVTTELHLIRHAPAITEGRLSGRRDVSADCTDAAGFAAIRGALVKLDHCYVSPALRCLQTAATLWPDATPTQDARLWEQDFGTWEGVAFADLPDLGTLSTPDLASHCPPRGESFLDLCHRVAPVLQDLARQGGKIAIVAHAGVIRAALGLALGQATQGLAFQISPLSLTSLLALPDGGWAITGVNRMRR